MALLTDKAVNRSVRILIVDDEKLICQAIASKIQRLQHGRTYETRWASSVVEALDLFAAEHYDVVITDINMPGMDGFALIKKLRELGTDTKIFVVSGYDHFEYVRKAFLLNVDDYLLKPVAVVELDEKLRTVQPSSVRGSTSASALEERNVSLLIRSVLDRIHGDETYKLSLKEIAAELQVSYSHLSAMFSEQMGCGYSTYQIQRRMERARLLLNDPALRIHEVAQKLGYDQANLFSRDYKHYFGVSPREARSQLTKEEMK